MNAEQKKSIFETLEFMLSDAEVFNAVCMGIFKEMDKDKSGDIDASELKEFSDKIQAELGMKSNKDQEAALMKEIDKNGNGKVELDEMELYLLKLFTN
jgi:Ca2+-binding EF-hand superfamily protein